MLSLLWSSLVFTAIGVYVPTDAADGDVRLVGRPMTYMGRVEIEMGSMWYSICEDGWGIEEADVVCRQLGFPEGAMFSSVSPRSDFGIGSGDMLWSDYTCTGAESDFLSCGTGGNLNSDDCDISQDVAIICNVPAYLGCYEIQEDEYPPDLIRVSSASGSIDGCLGVCRLHSTYAALGVQGDNNRCFCFSGDYTTLTALSNDRCNAECTDDDRSACGGVNAYSIYPVTLGELGATYIDVSTGFIYSPNFFGKYDSDLDTTWTISYSENKIVTVESIMFLLESGDLLTVSDGISTNTYDSNRASFTWSSGSTTAVTLQFTTADDSDGNYGFLLEYSTSVAPTVTIELTTEKIVTTEESKTTLADGTTSKTTESEGITTDVEKDTTAADGTERTDVTEPTTAEVATEVETDLTTSAPTESTALTTDVPDGATTLMNTEPACPVIYGSNDVSNQVDSSPTDQLIIASDMPFECDSVVTEVALHALAEATFTLFVLRQSEDGFTVVSKADIISSSTNDVVELDLTSSSATVVAKADDLVAIAYKAGTFSYSEDHGETMNFTIYDTEYSKFDTITVGDVLNLPDSSTDVMRQYPFQLTIRAAKSCDLSSDPLGGTYGASLLLEGQMTTLVCNEGFEAKFDDDDDDNDDNNYINVTCTADGYLISSGTCREESPNTIYIVIFTTIVGCLGFCLIIIYFAFICSKPVSKSQVVDKDVEKAPSDENILISMNDPEDDVDSPADEAHEEEQEQEKEGDEEGMEKGEDEEDEARKDNNEPDESGSQAEGDQSNPASSTGEVGGVDNPIYQSNDAMNANEWMPEEAGPDD